MKSGMQLYIRKVYSDILSDEQRFFLQIEDDAWGGEFIDVPEGLKHNIYYASDVNCRFNNDFLTTLTSSPIYQWG